MRMQRVFFWLILFASMALCVLWLMVIPRSAQRVHSAIPPESVYASRHINPAGRLDAFSGNPLGRSLLTSMGLDIHDIKDVSEDPEVQSWIQKLFSDEVYVAYVPGWAQAQKGQWVFASWVGGRSWRLEWLLRHADESFAQKVVTYGGRTIWQLDFGRSDNPGDLSVITVCLVEGMVLGSLGPDARMLFRMLDAYDSKGGLADISSDSCGDLSADDIGWGAIQNADESWPVEYAVHEMTPDYIDVAVCLPLDLRSTPASVDSEYRHLMQRFFRDDPLIRLQCAPAAWDDLLHLWLPKKAHDVLQNYFSTMGIRVVSGVVLSDEYSGRFAGIRWPGVVLALDGSDDIDPAFLMTDLFDQWNAAFRWGVIPRVEQVGNEDLFLIESTARNAYAKRPASELMAYASIGSTLFISSNSDVLRSLLERYAQVSLQEETGEHFDVGDANDRRAGFLWMDVQRARKPIRVALTAYMLKLMFEDREGSGKIRGHLEQVKAWIDAMESFGEGVAVLYPEGERIQLQLRLGSKKKEEDT